VKSFDLIPVEYGISNIFIKSSSLFFFDEQEQKMDIIQKGGN